MLGNLLFQLCPFGGAPQGNWGVREGPGVMLQPPVSPFETGCGGVMHLPPRSAPSWVAGAAAGFLVPCQALGPGRRWGGGEQPVTHRYVAGPRGGMRSPPEARRSLQTLVPAPSWEAEERRCSAPGESGQSSGVLILGRRVRETLRVWWGSPGSVSGPTSAAAGTGCPGLPPSCPPRSGWGRSSSEPLIGRFWGVYPPSFCVRCPWRDVCRKRVQVCWIFV